MGEKDKKEQHAYLRLGSNHDMSTEKRTVSQREQPKPRALLVPTVLLNRLPDRIVVVALAGRGSVEEGLESIVAVGEEKVE
jgi:hypothetical protein